MAKIPILQLSWKMAIATKAVSVPSYAQQLQLVQANVIQHQAQILAESLKGRCISADPC